ncbi:MAG: fibronectin type III domain-containing protein [Muribaculaceae bacterium]|nr:fibronectin type III domain-containing protein [Muribaculaceae bacterium]
MTKFTLSLLAAATVAAVSAGDAGATDLGAAANATPKVIAAARTHYLAPARSARTLHKPAKELRAGAARRHARAPFAEPAADGAIYSCSFDFLSDGSETAPAPLELDDWDNIPEELIGEENYGFGGQGIMQAGGALYIPFEYEEEPGWDLEGLMWTPDLYQPMQVTIELDVKIVEGCGVDTDDFWVYASDYSTNFDEDCGEITTEWTHLALNINAKDFVPESDDDSYYLTLFADGGADVVVKNVVIKGEGAELQVPVAQPYTDFTGTSFTARWSEVAGATGYYLTVYNYDPSTRTRTSKFLDAQFTENNYYTVTDITPGNFYSYQVSATNGSATTSESNFVIVCELPAPAGLTIAAGEDDKSLDIAWTATPGANYYVLTATSTRNVTAGSTVTLADADFSAVESTGTVAEPEESEFWFDARPELPGWEFTLGCSAPGAYGFWDNAMYTAYTGLEASLSSMDYDLSNITDGTVSVSVEAASPGNGMLAGILSFDESQQIYEVASAYRTTDDVPAQYTTYTFDLTGAAARSKFIFMTSTDGNTDGAILIRTLQISAQAAADGTVGIPVGSIETESTRASFSIALENGVTYTATVVPYLVDDEGYILATGKASEPASLTAVVSGIESVTADSDNATTSYYNLQGQKIAAPAAGTVAIKVAGGKATKVIF